MGAFLSPVAPLPGTLNIVKNIVGVYRTPLLEVSIEMRVHQHHAGFGLSRRRTPRGQLFHGAADRQGRVRDWGSIVSSFGGATRSRRADSLRASSGMNYDSGDFPALFDEALAGADLDGFAARKRDSEARGKLRGLGIGSFSKSPHLPARRWAASASRPMATSRSSPARSITDRAMPRPSRRCCRASSAFRSSASGWCRATAIN